jgi:hypothetical protein
MTYLQMYINLTSILGIAVFVLAITTLAVSIEAYKTWPKVLVWSLLAVFTVALIFCATVAGLLS